MEVRRYQGDDLLEIFKLFKETILSVNMKDYTKEQCMVWANSFTNIEILGERLHKSDAYVAELNGTIVGFGNITDSGEIDLLYVHKDFQRLGVATVILKALESIAKEDLTTEASITARPFFESKGYQVTEKQIKIVESCEFVNFKMMKEIRKRN